MKIVVFRGLYLGDIVAATGALRTLRRGFPAADITLVSLPWAVALTPHLPYVDRLLPYPGAPGLDGWKGEAGSEEDLEEFVARVRAERFDLAVNLHGRGPASTRLVARFGARRTAGFTNDDAPALDTQVPWDAETHESRKLLLLAEKVAGLPAGTADATPELRVSAEDDRRARTLIPTSSPTPSPDHPEVIKRVASFPYSRLPTPDSLERSDLVLVHPGASVAEKRWPGEAFGQVAKGLLQRGYTVAVTGSPGEKKLTRQVIELAPGAIDLGGRTDLSTLVALAARADVLVSNDTGPAHLAYASSTPSVTLFGPSTDMERWGPLDRRRHTILFGDPISEISVGAVIEHVERLVHRREEERSA